MDMSLDEYIQKNGIKKPFVKMERFEETSPMSSKFSRYERNNDDIDETDAMDVSSEMPNLVPASFQKRTADQPQSRQLNPKKMVKPIHERLGDRASECESINTKNLKPYRRRNNWQNGDFKWGVQHRLNKNFVNPAIVARNNIGLNAVNSFMASAVSSMSNGIGMEGSKGANLVSLFANKLMETITDVKQPAGKKYNMELQKEISALQGKQLFYSCPGAAVISYDGPGVETPLNVPQNITGMSMNQRFA